MSVTYSYKDMGLNKILDGLKELNGLDLTIGFQGADGRRRYDTGVTVATVAAFNEYGTDENPARPFLRTAMERYKREIGDAFEGAVRDVLNKGKNPVEALASVGQLTVDKVREHLDRAGSWAKALDADTVRAKRDDEILRDTDLMYNSLSWAVRSKAGSILRQGGTL